MPEFEVCTADQQDRRGELPITLPCGDGYGAVEGARTHDARRRRYITPFWMEVAVVTHEVLLRQTDRCPNPVSQPQPQHQTQRPAWRFPFQRKLLSRLQGRAQYHNRLTRTPRRTTRIDRPKLAPHARYESPAVSTPSIDRAKRRRSRGECRGATECLCLAA